MVIIFTFFRRYQRGLVRPKYDHQQIINFSKMGVEALLKHFKTTLKGLTPKEVEKRLELSGLNVIEARTRNPILKLLGRAFLNPFILLLIVIIIITIGTDIIFATNNDYTMVIILLFIVIISGITHFIQDYRAEKSLENLKQMITNTTGVRRKGKQQEVSLTRVVPGDILILSAGDMLPCDARILTCKDLFVSQSSFTGESEPVEKLEVVKEITDIFHLDNICYMGTNVISGSAVAIALATGSNTYLGTMSKNLTKIKTKTAFDEGISKVSKILIRLTILMTILVFIINVLLKGNPLLALMFALTVAVGVTPELLPMIVTSNLAKGSLAMAKRQTIVKNLNSIQNLGAINILCTDKTGTITEDNIILDEYLDIYGKTSQRVLKYAYLNSYLQTGLKNTLDKAVINKAKEKKLYNVVKDYQKVDEIPFDFTRRRMSVILEKKGGEKRLITKGAAEEILAISSFVEMDGLKQPLTQELKLAFKETLTALNERGFRVLAVARKNEGIADVGSFGVKDEKEMVIMGFISFLDPPKADAKTAISILKEQAVAVKVITGDNDSVARTICAQVGIPTKHILMGSAIEKMTELELLEKVEEVTLFAKISPLQKERIVAALQQKGHVVGYLGDGINDAAALMQADVGISVDTGVEIAKEAADIILLEKSLVVLGQGIIEGRKVFANIMKYLRMSTSSNVGNMISVIFASILLPFLPLLPIHILVQNLLYDFSQTGIPFDNVDDNYINKPQKWANSKIERFILWFAPISSIFDFLMFAVLWYIIGANTIGAQALFQSGWFIMGIISQTLIVHILRTEKVPFYKSKASSPIMIATLLVTVIGLILPMTPLGALIGLVALPSIYYYWLILIMLLYVIFTDIIKTIYYRRYAS